MRRLMVLLFVVLALFGVGFVLAPDGPVPVPPPVEVEQAEAHSSDYCGHGVSGVGKKTVFIDSHRHYYSCCGGSIVGWAHHHQYAHSYDDVVYPPWEHVVKHKKCRKH